MTLRKLKTIIFVLLASVMRDIIAEPDKKVEIKIDPDNNLTETLLEKGGSSKDIDIKESDNNELTIWEFEQAADDGVPIIRNSYSPFETKKCYIIQERYSRSIPEGFQTYYWVGEYSPKGVAANAAQYAVILDFKARYDDKGPSREKADYSSEEDELKKLLLPNNLPEISDLKGKKFITKIQREAEDYETPSFIEFLKKHGATNLLYSLNMGPKELEEDDTKMFVLTKNEKETVIDEVEVSLQILERYDSKICIVLVSKTVYVYCGTNTGYNLRRGSEELAKIMLKRMGRRKSNYKITRDNKMLDNLPLQEKRKMSDLFEELPYKRTTNKGKDVEFTPEELKAILNPSYIYPKGYFNHVNMRHVRVYIDKHNPTLRREKHKSGGFLNRWEINKNDCYICDVESNRGLVIWMGESSSISVRARCAREAENYLVEEGLHCAMPINYFDENEKPYKIDYLGLLFNTLDKNRMDPVSLIQASYPPERR